MKKFTLKRTKQTLSLITASTLAANMLFIPPCVPEEKFSLKNKIVMEKIKDDGSDKSLNKSNSLSKANSNQNLKLARILKK